MSIKNIRKMNGIEHPLLDAKLSLPELDDIDHPNVDEAVLNNSIIQIG